MFRSLYTAASGMYAQELNMNEISENLANVNTIGYKKGRVNFQDLMYSALQEPGAVGPYGGAVQVSSEQGSGVRAASIQKIFTPGQYDHTGNPLDLAIYGNGFFEVKLPDGKTGFTRDGMIQLNDKGEFLAGGHPIVGVKIPKNVTGLQVESSGTIMGYLNNQTKRVKIGQIQLARFLNPSGLRAQGDVYYDTAVSGPKITGTAGENGFGMIKAGYLEKANVNIIQEMMDIVMAQRAYEFNAKAVTATNNMLSITTQLQPA